MDSFLAGTKKKKKASAYALEPICVCAIVLGICKPHEQLKLTKIILSHQEMGKLHPEASIVKEAGEGIGRHFF